MIEYPILSINYLEQLLLIDPSDKTPFKFLWVKILIIYKLLLSSLYIIIIISRLYPKQKNIEQYVSMLILI
jgi:hypothetical protein